MNVSPNLERASKLAWRAYEELRRVKDDSLGRPAVESAAWEALTRLHNAVLDVAYLDPQFGFNAKAGLAGLVTLMDRAAEVVAPEIQEQCWPTLRELTAVLEAEVAGQ
jgi:hypothetical protein